MAYYEDNSPSGCGLCIGIVLLIILLFVHSIGNGEHISSRRDEANMIYLQDGFCYDADTRIIHRESIIDAYRGGYDTPVFTPYINSNGNYCRYENGQWVELLPAGQP